MPGKPRFNLPGIPQHMARPAQTPPGLVLARKKACMNCMQKLTGATGVKPAPAAFGAALTPVGIPGPKQPDRLPVGQFGWVTGPAAEFIHGTWDAVWTGLETSIAGTAISAAAANKLNFLIFLPVIDVFWNIAVFLQRGCEKLVKIQSLARPYR